MRFFRLMTKETYVSRPIWMSGSQCGMGHNRSALLDGIILTYLGMMAVDAVTLIRQRENASIVSAPRNPLSVTVAWAPSSVAHRCVTNSSL